jgi:hypothetical protein
MNTENIPKKHRCACEESDFEYPNVSMKRFFAYKDFIIDTVRYSEHNLNCGFRQMI